MREHDPFPRPDLPGARHDFLGSRYPTEAGAMGVIGALALAWSYGRLTWPALPRHGIDDAYHGHGRLYPDSALVFSLVFQGVGGKVDRRPADFLPGRTIGFLIFVNAFIFVIAFFLDFFEIAFIIIPMLAPAADKLGIDLIWFGVLICANIQTSFMHPPFGFALFYLRGIAPKTIKTSDIYWGAIPWIGTMVILVAIVIFWPQSVTYWIDKSHQDRSLQGQDRNPDAGYSAAAQFRLAEALTAG